MSLNEAIEDHQTGTTYTVTRTPAREYDEHGRLLPASTPSTFPIVASVQTATPEDIEDVPEGQSTNGAKLILTATELRTRHASNEPDTIAIGGKTYVVHTVDEVEHWGEVHYEVVALKDDSI